MVKIRLSKLGKKNDPFYRIVAIEHSNKVQGKALSILGYWHPKTNLLKIDKKEIEKWVSLGAQISEKVKELLAK